MCRGRVPALQRRCGGGSRRQVRRFRRGRLAGGWWLVRVRRSRFQRRRLSGRWLAGRRGGVRFRRGAVLSEHSAVEPVDGGVLFAVRAIDGNADPMPISGSADSVRRTLRREYFCIFVS